MLGFSRVKVIFPLSRWKMRGVSATLALADGRSYPNPPYQPLHLECFGWF